MTNRDESLPEGNVIEGIALVTEVSKEQLNQRQIVDYAHHRKDFVEWLCHFGKKPKQAEGYAPDTAHRRAGDLDRFYRWWWNERGGYTTQIPTEAADQYLRELATQDISKTHKANTYKSLVCYWRWREIDWEPVLVFKANDAATQPRDYLKREERQLVREAALEWGSVPSYNSLTPKERDEWKNHLAMRYRMPAEEVGPKEFERANGFKYPSLVSASMDAALRPKEVYRACVSWVEAPNERLIIPSPQSTKSNENWEVALRADTTRYLERWLDERDLYERYHGTDRLWLTRHGNPYGTDALRPVMNRLREIAGLDAANRTLTWYAMRHSTGTYMTAEKGRNAAAAQLRHSSPTTTSKYDHGPIEERREALDAM